MRRQIGFELDAIRRTSAAAGKCEAVRSIQTKLRTNTYVISLNRHKPAHGDLDGAIAWCDKPGDWFEFNRIISAVRLRPPFSTEEKTYAQ